jgi:hypothetical protein
MRFLILRVLTHSELGMFHEYRRQGKEGSKQRAINFDGEVVDRVFPSALDTDRIELDLRLITDDGVAEVRQSLKRQDKNWRLEGHCPRDVIYDFVEPGCLFAMEIDAGGRPAAGSWAVFPRDSEVTRAVLGDGAAGAVPGDRHRCALRPTADPRVLGQAWPPAFRPVRELPQFRQPRRLCADDAPVAWVRIR